MAITIKTVSYFGDKKVADMTKEELVDAIELDAQVIERKNRELELLKRTVKRLQQERKGKK